VERMNLKDDIRPISYIKTNAADMLKRVNETHNPIIITQNGEARAVLLDTESYQSLVNSVGILKVLQQGERDIEDGKVHSQESVFESIEKKLESLKSKA
jgi:prevent-host-death family protein